MIDPRDGVKQQGLTGGMVGATFAPRTVNPRISIDAVSNGYILTTMDEFGNVSQLVAVNIQDVCSMIHQWGVLKHPSNKAMTDGKQA